MIIKVIIKKIAKDRICVFKLRKQAMIVKFFMAAFFLLFYIQEISGNVSSNQEALLKSFNHENAKYEKTLGIQLKEANPDKVILQMTVTTEKHINQMGIVHGGAVMSLADTAMWAACVNQGNSVVTVDFNINFIKKVMPEGTITAVSYVIHHGSQTMVAEAEIYDKDNRLVAKARGTFFVTGKV